jgi:hypothetical protein
MISHSGCPFLGGIGFLLSWFVKSWADFTRFQQGMQYF